MTCGIYEIRNVIDGKCYIGSAANIEQRWRAHLSYLSNAKHHSIILQRAWDKHGSCNFEFNIIEQVEDRTKLIEREQYWINRFDSSNNELGYNICKKAGSRIGTFASEETKRKMVLSHLNMSNETRAKWLSALSAARVGYKHTQETINKMTGQKRTEETKAKMSIANRGRVMSIEQRKQISLRMTGVSIGRQSPETIAKRVASTRATKIARGLINVSC